MTLEYKDLIYIILAILGIIVALLAIFTGEYVRMVAGLKVDVEVKKAKAELKAILKFADAIKIYQKDIGAAIALSENAIPDLTGVELIQAKSNLAYYYAYGAFIESKNRAILLAQETLIQAFLHPDRTNNFKINYGYVIMKYASTIEEVQRSIDFLENILQRKSLEEDDIEEIKGYLLEAGIKRAKLLQATGG